MASPLDIIGKLAKLGGMGASMAGFPMVGVPLAVGGSALEGAAEGGGVKGAVGGAVQSGLGAALPGIAKGFDAPVDTGSFTARSSSGSPLTVPGIRKSPIEVGGATLPASPSGFGGS